MISLPEIRNEVLKIYKNLDKNKQQEFRKFVRNETFKPLETIKTIFQLINTFLNKDEEIDLDQTTVAQYFLITDKIDLVGIGLLYESNTETARKIDLEDEQIKEVFNSIDFEDLGEEYREKFLNSYQRALELLTFELNELANKINEYLEDK